MGAGMGRADNLAHTARRMTAPFVRGGSSSRGRGEADKPGSPGAGVHNTVMYRARAFKDELRCRAFRGSATGTCARVPADQSARLPITGPLSGGATLPTLRGAERKVAEPGARNAATAIP